MLARTEEVPPHYRVVDPRTGEVLSTGEGYGPLLLEAGAPRVIIFIEN
jgi:hypothetical protein